jgi:MerR family transcriptional regulator/heat shock protein HspR
MAPYRDFVHDLSRNQRYAMAHESTPRSRVGVYGITVASELSGFDPQTLRLYERRGLLTPARTSGGTRRYSDDDLVVLQRIGELVDAGINIAGVARILELEADNLHLERELEVLRAGHAPGSPILLRARKSIPHDIENQSNL